MKYLRDVLSIAGMVVALIAVNFWNLFDYVPFVPKGFEYEVGMTVYFTVAEILMGRLDEKIRAVLGKAKGKLQVVFYRRSKNPNIGHDPEFQINGDAPIEIKVKVSVEGSCDNLRKCRLHICASSLVDFDWGDTSDISAVRIDSAYNATIDIGKICGGSEHVDELSESFFLMVRKKPGVRDSEIMISFEMDSKVRGIEYKHNKARIQIGED